MKYDFIEIGTSDFRTLIETNDGVGLSIEPIKFYLDNLPNKSNVTKVNVGISNYNGEAKIFYITPDNIKKYNLPNWVRGCNSINSPHPTVKKLLGDKYDDIINIDLIKIINWETLIDEYNITEINTLKIDTEGHDAVILRDYYNNCLKNKGLLAKTIIFENNELSDIKSINVLIKDFKTLGYSGQKVNFDYILRNK